MDTAGPAAWPERVVGELLDGGLAVVHHWYGHTVWPLLGHADVAALHLRGTPVPAEIWRATLKPALRDVYRRAYPYDDAYTTAAAAAGGFALAHGYSEAEATEYGETYAATNTDANVTAHADANAAANAAALAAAFAVEDVTAYAATYPAAFVRACVLAGGPGARQRLADGLRASLTP
ncbi:hypothetical protein OHS58_08935 [Amycolatopsis sp. NBC_00348]|uniref:hypothetical protein n=1 Tax=Amycolatopsis sp. NBC_00348 TaxID=2975956 RepID=UPI002E26B4FA